MASKPNDFAVRNQDDGQVFENGVDGDAQELERFGSSVNDRYEECRDGKPGLGVLHVKVSKVDDPEPFHHVHGSTADDGLNRQEEKSH